jgi:hypothetical protein
MNNGGPAFPGIETRINGLHEQYRAYYGMTLRDWFAGTATEEDIRAHMTYSRHGITFSVTREQAKYRYADAMLKAREVSDE